jgi:hypothetical protein
MVDPLELPVAGAIGAAVVVYSFSRVMLGLPSKSATVIAFAVAAAIVMLVDTLVGVRRTASKTMLEQGLVPTGDGDGLGGVRSERGRGAEPGLHGQPGATVARREQLGVRRCRHELGGVGLVLGANAIVHALDRPGRQQVGQLCRACDLVGEIPASVDLVGDREPRRRSRCWA